jgi:Protein of unknown function (DUF2851)
MFPEDFLHYIWKFKYFNTQDLATTNAEALSLMYVGDAHTDSGPDFRNALIKINETVWAGNVEIHIRSSDWLRHKHQNDAAYANVVLHVVYDFDTPILRPDGTEVPCLVLRERISPHLLSNFLALQRETQVVACHRLLPEVPAFRKSAWLERLIVERLEQKTAYFSTLQAVKENNWGEAFYQALARGLGASLNADPMEQVARSLSNQILAKNKHSLFALEALIFGQAGVLQDAVFTDEYPLKLQKEYNYLCHKYKISAINPTAWRFSRLRPANFPTIRLAQLAALIYKSEHLWSKIMAAESLETVHELLEVTVSEYWHTHYVFDKDSPKHPKKLGKTTIDLLIINTIIPFLFLYGTLRADDAMRDKAIKWFETLPPEQNHIIATWKTLGLEPKNAADAQALLHLYKNYCTPKRCLHCGIAASFLKA